MKFRNDLVDQLKSTVDIVHVVQGYVRLKKTGSNFIGLCPFHSEKTPSFHVRQNPPYYYCFGCNAKGDVFSFIQSIERISFPETLKFLADKYGISLPKLDSNGLDQNAKERQVLLDIHEKACRIFRTQLNQSNESKLALGYLRERGLTEKTLDQFDIGYSLSFSDSLVRKLGEDFSKEMLLKSGLIQASEMDGRYFDRFRKRIIYPIRNESSRVIAFGGRILGDGQPKYLNSPETLIYSKSRTLYALDQARESIRKKNYAILVEGYMDCIALHQSGVTNVIASCGTSFTELQARLLARHSNRIVVNFDPDTAGGAATLRSLALFLENGFKIKVLALPGGDDPDAFIKKRGVEEYLLLLEKAPLYFDHLLEQARRLNDLKTIEGKITAVNMILPYLAMTSNRIERVEQTKQVAEFLGIEESIIREELKKTISTQGGKLEINRNQLKTNLTVSEKYLLKAVLDQGPAAREIMQELSVSEDYVGLQSESIFREIVALFKEEGRIDPSRVQEKLANERDKEFLSQALFSEMDMDQAVRSLDWIRRYKTEQEITLLQKKIKEAELAQDFELLSNLHSKKAALKRMMAS